jgi:hydrogenase maturation protease
MAGSAGRIYRKISNFYRNEYNQIMPEKRKVVLGLGNLLQKDEGFGVQVLNRLAETLPAGERDEFELVDGGVLGLNLLPLVDECSYLLVFDAIDAGKLPGTVIEMSGAEIPLYANIKLSEHQIGFQEVLGLAMLRGTFPEHLILIGVQPEELSTGMDLSPAVQAVVDEVVQRGIVILRGW